MSFKNYLLRSLVKIASPRPAKRPDRILVASTTALGDTLWAMPALESLKKSFPQTPLSVLTSPIGLQILDQNPWTDEIHELKNPLSLYKNLRGQYDTILIFHSSQRLVLPLCASLGPTRIAATKGLNKGLDDLLTDPVPPIQEHEIRRRLRLVETIGGQIHSETLSFFLRPEEIQTFSGCWVAIHPGAKDPYKLWPLDHFATVGRELKERGAEILITGNQSERPLMEKLSTQIPGAHLINPSLSLRAFAGHLSGMSLLICNDSGPFHLASALKIPAIGIYSPTLPHLCGPHHSKTALALSKPPTCTPCLRRNCREPFCLQQIGPEQVIQKALEYIL